MRAARRMGARATPLGRRRGQRTRPRRRPDRSAPPVAAAPAGDRGFSAAHACAVRGSGHHPGPRRNVRRPTQPRAACRADSGAAYRGLSGSYVTIKWLTEKHRRDSVAWQSHHTWMMDRSSGSGGPTHVAVAARSLWALRD